MKIKLFYFFSILFTSFAFGREEPPNKNAELEIFSKELSEMRDAFDNDNKANCDSKCVSHLESQQCYDECWGEAHRQVRAAGGVHITMKKDQIKELDSSPLPTKGSWASLLESNKEKVNAIYRKYLSEIPNLAGKITFEFSILPNGMVAECHVVESDLASEKMRSELLYYLQGIRFDSENPNETKHQYTYEFLPY